jgi:predicted nucleic acid-binding protein
VVRQCTPDLRSAQAGLSECRRAEHAAAASQALSNFAELPLLQIDSGRIVAAIYRCRNSQLSFWDARLVQAAIEGRASTLYSEDLQHGQTLDSLRALNPFGPAPI